MDRFILLPTGTRINIDNITYYETGDYRGSYINIRYKAADGTTSYSFDSKEKRDEILSILDKMLNVVNCDFIC